ncbi:flagellar hook-associated protein FlgK [Marinicrinis lubricantis]|uniref:Flagellar hook-associated protein 1 n=1 Tax=Marinicrinis lubricantis TaxID=2086470 RepID=A0ABW1IT13_9BACL
MRSTFHTLETALRSLNTQQAALSTTGHNIANANTKGYSRQVVNMQTSIPIEAYGMTHSAIPGQLGTGVEFSSITRIREQFLDHQYWNENKSLGSWEVQLDTLQKLEGIVNEPSDTGLRSVLDKFWESWSILSNNPEDITGRKLVRENAIALANTFNLTSKQLTDLQNDLTQNIEVKATEINDIASSIADLNKQIQKIEGFGDNANDLRDQRDLLVDQLSKVANVTVQETPQGYDVAIGGITLVQGQTATAIDSAVLVGAYGSGDLGSGEVYGMIKSRDGYVADYINQLNTMANTIANGDITITLPEGSVLPDGVTLNGVSGTLTSDLTVTIKGLNELHKLGYTLSDPVQTGVDFFVAGDGSGTITAANFSLNSIIDADPNRIAASLRTEDDGSGNKKVIKGNNTLATLISQLRETKFRFQGTGGTNSVISNGTIDDYFTSIVGQLGVQSAEAERQQSNQQVIVDQVDVRRQSVSGVSLDEEMANMIKFQHAYNAAARVMTTVDELLDKIINGMGVVGR